ncbi:MAG: hypothetical protein QME12_08480 [Nanoarchaeota archaeon]|nr:hypothetical protein [Nanoarchaeota archaeon]
MGKLVILALSIAILLAASASAQMQCSVVPFNSCPQTSVKVIGMTSLSQGGSHASIPSDQTNALAACCSGVEGLSVNYASQGADIYLTSARDSHVSRVSGENGIKINRVSCGYFNSCENYDACVFSISGDRDAHISDCGNYAFSTKLCCSEGALIGEGLLISPEEGPREKPIVEEQAPASPEEGNGTLEQPVSVNSRRVELPPYIKNFLKNFLRGGTTGNFFMLFKQYP